MTTVIAIILLITLIINRLLQHKARKKADEVTLQRCMYVDIAIIVIWIIQIVAQLLS